MCSMELSWEFICNCNIAKETERMWKISGYVKFYIELIKGTSSVHVSRRMSTRRTIWKFCMYPLGFSPKHDHLLDVFEAFWCIYLKEDISIRRKAQCIIMIISVLCVYKVDDLFSQSRIRYKCRKFWIALDQPIIPCTANCEVNGIDWLLWGLNVSDLIC